MSYVHSGIGAHPDQVCFDPDRPSWLPYWVDTFSEGACWWDTTLLGDVPGTTITHGKTPDGKPSIDLSPDPNAKDPNAQKVDYTNWLILGGILVGIGFIAGKK